MKTLKKATLYKLQGVPHFPNSEDIGCRAVGIYPLTATGTLYFSMSATEPTALAEMETQAEGTGFNGTLALSTVPVWAYVTEDSGTISEVQIPDNVLATEIGGPLT